MNQQIWDNLTPIQKFDYLDSKWHNESIAHNDAVKARDNKLNDKRERTYFDYKTHTFKLSKKL